MTQSEVIKKLKRYIFDNHGGKQKGLAKEIGKTDAFVSSVMLGKKRPSDEMLDLLGMEVIVERKYIYKRKV